MLEIKAKAAIAARMELRQALLYCAAVLSRAAEVSIALAAAAEREDAALMAYVTALEAQLSQQQALS